MEMQAEYKRNEGAQQGKLWKEQIHRWSKLTKQLYKETLMLTKEEQERLMLGLIRYAVVRECVGLFGPEKDFFLRMMELRERYRLEIEEGVTVTEASDDGADSLTGESLQKPSESDHDHDHIIYNNILNNNILNNHINKNISIAESSQHQDHDHDNMERESVILNDKNDPFDSKAVAKTSKAEQSLANLRCATLSVEEPAPSQGDTRWVDDLIQEERDGTAAAERVIQAVEQLCQMSCYDSVRDEITGYTGRLGEELCLLAVERARRYRGMSWSYIRKIMESWYRTGIRTPEEAAEHCRQFDEGRRRTKGRAFTLPQS